MAPAAAGIHHVTAIAGDPQRNLQFYTNVLGLRLVKLTVNFDDPGTYHLYFGDASGSPGSILTFFPWPSIRRGRVGSGQVTAAAFAVPGGALDAWRARLALHQVPVEEAARFGEAALRFEDPDGLPIELVGTAWADSASGAATDEIAADQAIRGFHSATLTEEGYDRTAALLEQMGLRFAGTEGHRYRYAGASPGPGAIVDVVCAPDARTGTLGAGTVHHMAWRTRDDEAQLEWRRTLLAQGYNVSPVMDRRYFRSIYFREPGGVLFEIATDAPGFATDEPIAQLGERLMLPPWLEPRRAAIERALPPLAFRRAPGAG